MSVDELAAYLRRAQHRTVSSVPEPEHCRRLAALLIWHSRESEPLTLAQIATELGIGRRYASPLRRRALRLFRYAAQRTPATSWHERFVEIDRMGPPASSAIFRAAFGEDLGDALRETADHA